MATFASFVCMPTPAECVEDDIASRVVRVVVRRLRIPARRVTECAAFIDDLHADSLETVQIIMDLEAEFGCEIPDDAAQAILTVGDAIRYIEKCRNIGATSTRPAACPPPSPLANGCEVGPEGRRLFPLR
jgi:acyl carrier protein